MSAEPTGGAGSVGSPEYDYRRESARTFEDAVAAVEREILAQGFSVRVVHDIQATLAAKGFRVKPIRIYEVDGTPAIVESLCADSPECPIERLMPCRINVFVEHGSTVITVLRPTLLCRVFPEARLDSVARGLEALLLGVVDSAA
ncbi:MAG: DUF302 domain-containing protein [Coriobacteriia bacterium]|nr:DUF302 domain-containing protein [Coriobacteriia bacterium]